MEIIFFLKVHKWYIHLFDKGLNISQNKYPFMCIWKICFAKVCG